jgi:sodium-coupled neutral amino acid transporter 11
MAIRYFDGSYAPGGKYFDSLPVAPIFTNDGFKLNHLTFVLLSMLSTAYIAHYSAPKFYNELQNPTMGRFNTVVGGAFGASIAFFIFVMVIGYSTFGGNTLGFVLNNYSSADSMATVARFAIGLALLTGYPFTFSALREGVIDFMKVPTHQRSKVFAPVTVGLLSVVTLLALVLNDVGFVVSMSGALFGCMLMFVVPAVMNIKLLAATGGNKLEVVFNYGIAGTGVVMAILGVYVSVMKQLGHL